MTAESTERAGPTVTTDGDRICLDGSPVDVWGIRTSSATATDDQCEHLIGQLDDYVEHGVNAVTVFYQGCMGANYDPFSADGTEIDPDHQRRLERIVEACAERGMLVIVGIFYQHAPLGLESVEGVHAAVRTVTESLRPYGHVVINIANEHSSYGWGEFADVFDMRDPDRIVDLCRTVHDADPDRLVGGGGYLPETCAVIGRSGVCDVLMFDTGSEALTGHDSGQCHERLTRAGVREKPVVNVELFGGWTESFPRGVYPPEARLAYEQEVRRAAARPGLSVFFHSNLWCQHPELPMRYDLGGQGTADDPGIRWYFEQVRAARERNE